MRLTDKQDWLWLHPSYKDTMRSMARIIVLLALIQLVAWLVPAAPGAQGITAYLPFHTLLETISIVISMLVFSVGWNSRDGRQSGNVVLLACVFFSVGLLDFLHTASYGGMPDFITFNDAQKHLYFWLAARFLAAVALLMVIIRPWRTVLTGIMRYLIFAASLLGVALIAGLVWLHPAWLPDMFIPGQGLTAPKKNIEYGIIAINVLTALLLWRKMRQPQPYNAVLLFGAVCVMAMSEFFFTLYTTMTGSYNVLGHVYKVIAYLLIYRAIVVEVIEAPYNRLAETQHNLAMSLHASNTGLWDWDVASNATHFSAEWKAQLGYLPDELPDTFSTWEALLHAEDRDAAMRYVRDFLASHQRNYENEFRLRHRDGSYRWILARGEKQFDRTGNTTRLIGTHIDITVRKQAEMALQLNQYALDHAPDAVYWMRPDGRFIYVNEVACRTLGYTRVELLSMGVADIDPNLPHGVPQEMAQTTERLGSTLVETTHRTKSGSIIPVEVNVALITYGGVQYHCAFVRDITERKLMEAAQQKSNELLQSVIEHSPIRVFWKDKDSRYLGCNSLFARDAGLSGSDELIGKNDFEMGWRDQAEAYRADDQAVMTSGIAKLGYEEAQSTPQGDTIWLRTSKVPLLDGAGKSMGLLGIYEDITPSKQANLALRDTAKALAQANQQIEEERARLAQRVEERTAQLQQANQAKDSFLASMSHEIRTPLAGLLGMMELLGLSNLAREQNELLAAAQNSGKSLLRIVNDILDWSKIEAGKMGIAPRVASISELLKEVATTYGQVASAKSIRLVISVDDNISAAHRFDSLRLSQILNNFTSNAIKFSARGNVELRAELVARQAGSEVVRLCVKDNGIGISLEQQERLFQHYEQGSADTARMYGGTGLGLSICQRLAELMQGELSVKSTPGSGSTFCVIVSLPVASVAEQRELMQGLEHQDDRSAVLGRLELAAPSKQLSILVVDDHPVNRMLLQQQLQRLGLQSDIEAYAIVALAHWQERHYDLVITDCHMPEMDGYEFTRNIRELERQSGAPRIPIIAWTANVLADEAERCNTAGMDDLLTKPTELAVLRAMLVKWLPKGVTSAPQAVVAEQHSKEAAFDVAVLNRFVSGHEVQREMLRVYEKQMRLDLDELQSALQQEDSAATVSVAHRIKGASRMVGALELGDLCERIEHAVKRGELGAARTLADSVLATAFARFRAASAE